MHTLADDDVMTKAEFTRRLAMLKAREAAANTAINSIFTAASSHAKTLVSSRQELVDLVLQP